MSREAFEAWALRNTSLPSAHEMAWAAWQAALAQQQAEPVAWGMLRADGLLLDVICPDEHEAFAGEYTVPLYATPQQAEPVATVLDGGDCFRLAAYLPPGTKLYAAPAVPADLQETASRIESGEITNAHFSHRNLVMCSKEHYAALVDASAAPAAQCDGGTCGAGGYCADCPKQQPAPAPVVPAWLHRMDEILSNATVTRTDAEIVDAAWLAFKEGWESMSAAPAVQPRKFTDDQLLEIYWKASWNSDGNAPMNTWERDYSSTIHKGLRAVANACYGIAAPGSKP